MKRLLQSSLIVSILFVVWVISSNYPFNKSYYVKEIEKEYAGSIDSIYFKRSKNLRIKTDKDSVIIVSGLSKELVQLVAVGDSIVKIKNKNCCFIEKDGHLYKCKYIYVGDQYDLCPIPLFSTDLK